MGTKYMMNHLGAQIRHVQVHTRDIRTTLMVKNAEAEAVGSIDLSIELRLPIVCLDLHFIRDVPDAI